jgi:hypothetical protein
VIAGRGLSLVDWQAVASEHSNSSLAGLKAGPGLPGPRAGDWPKLPLPGRGRGAAHGRLRPGPHWQRLVPVRQRRAPGTASLRLSASGSRRPVVDAHAQKAGASRPAGKSRQLATSPSLVITGP